MSNPYLNESPIKTLMRRRMLQVWVHSYIYYVLDDSKISDSTWSKWAKELACLIKQYPAIFNSIPHHEIFTDFTGDTGFDIANKADNGIITKAYYLLRLLGKEDKNGKSHKK